MSPVIGSFSAAGDETNAFNINQPDSESRRAVEAIIVPGVASALADDVSLGPVIVELTGGAVDAAITARDLVRGADSRIPQASSEERFVRAWVDQSGSVALGIESESGDVFVGGVLEVGATRQGQTSTLPAPGETYWRAWTDSFGRVQLGLRRDGGVDIPLGTGASGSGTYPGWSTRKASWNPALAVYNLHARSLMRWRAAYGRARAGVGTAHLSALGDSRTYGAEGSGVTYPKWLNSWPGRNRSEFVKRTADPGTGIVPLWDELFTYPAGDPRYSWSSGVTSKTTYGTPTVGYGPQGLACALIPSGAWVDFAPTQQVNSFVLYLVAEPSGAGLATVKVDGVVVGTVSLATTASGGTLTRRSGYGENQIVVDVPAGSLGTHTVRVEGPSSGAVNFVAVEARTGRHGVRVSNMARSSSRLSEWTLDSGDGRSGLPWHTDAVRADLQIVMPISNDRNRPADQVKTSLATIIERQRPLGDVLLIAPGMPDYTAIGGTAANWRAIVRVMYELADTYDVPLVDLTWSWVDYPSANGLGLFADAIHENDTGSQIIADLVTNILTGV